MLTTFYRATGWLDEAEQEMETQWGVSLLNTVAQLTVTADGTDADRIGRGREHQAYVARLRRMIHRRRRELQVEMANDIRREPDEAILSPEGHQLLAWYLS